MRSFEACISVRVSIVTGMKANTTSIWLHITLFLWDVELVASNESNGLTTSWPFQNIVYLIHEGPTQNGNHFAGHDDVILSAYIKNIMVRSPFTNMN